ncbi:MAG TPA: hypothetical protein VFQ35_16375 [Polyangiaceae bacterium]|nr:hypothetical protein [Polyangiaceae bacterium]
MRFGALCASAAALLGASSCKHAAESRRAEKPLPSSSAAPPVDRLAKGELPPGREALFGLVIPRGMTVQGQFKDSALAFGDMDSEAVANYVRDRVAVSHVEVGAARTIFPAARILEGPPSRVFRIEVVGEGAGTRLLVEDVTPPPPPPPENISDTERWRRAGFTRDGKPLDMNALK